MSTVKLQNIIFCIIIICGTIVAFSMSQDEEVENSIDEKTYQPIKMTPTSGVRLAWIIVR